jgi:CDP-diacylglycerol--serine O-phosphatidyltransferase
MFNLANLFTGFNLIAGILSIILTLNGRIDLAPLLILAGFLFDFFDGFIARKLKKDGPIGVQLDSLADLVTFGVAPGMLVMVVMVMHIEAFQHKHFYEIIQFDFNLWVESILAGNTDYFIPLIALIIPFMSMFRLAKFNVDERQSTSFIGLPTPAHTAFYLSWPLVLSYDIESVKENWDILWIIFDPNFIAAVVVLMSILLVTEVPLFSFKVSSYGWRSNKIRYSFLLISLGLIFIFKYWSLSIIVILYLILSLFDNYNIKKKEQ